VPRAIAMVWDAGEAKDLTASWMSGGDEAWTGGQRTWSGSEVGTRSLPSPPALAWSAPMWLPPTCACSAPRSPPTPQRCRPQHAAAPLRGHRPGHAAILDGSKGPSTNCRCKLQPRLGRAMVFLTSHHRPCRNNIFVREKDGSQRLRWGGKEEKETWSVWVAHFSSMQRIMKVKAFYL
jgi:hypothetical protein